MLIEQVPTFNFLNITLDETLSWKNHTKMDANKISRVIGILFRLKNIFPKEILLTLYNTLIYSYIHYGLLVWGIESYAECTPLFQLIKLINAMRCDPTDTILEIIAQNNQCYCQLSYNIKKIYLDTYDPICRIRNCFVCKL